MNCCVCNRSDTSLYFAAGSHQLVRCNHCGLVYAANFTYNAIAYQGDDYFVRKNEYIRQWKEFCAVFEVLLDKIMRYKQHGRLLDVGAGVGALLHIASKRGFTTYGVEVSDWASAYARDERGLDVVTGTLQDAAFPEAYFDIIVINHVLEHVTAPLEVLTEARRILKSDGLLVVGVPNIGSIMARLLREKWPSLRPDEHMWHFAPNSLRSLIDHAGFREVWFEAHDNYPVQGWSPKAIVRRIINRIAVITDRSEAMLLFAQKQPVHDMQQRPDFLSGSVMKDKS
jgi:2-polyprenyl-3-methyl-5-hydroxy-6-metoxy-1,4-benzoquinol methylase